MSGLIEDCPVTAPPPLPKVQQGSSEASSEVHVGTPSLTKESSLLTNHSKESTNLASSPHGEHLLKGEVSSASHTQNASPMHQPTSDLVVGSSGVGAPPGATSDIGNATVEGSVSAAWTSSAGVTGGEPKRSENIGNTLNLKNIGEAHSPALALGAHKSNAIPAPPSVEESGVGASAPIRINRKETKIVADDAKAETEPTKVVFAKPFGSSTGGQFISVERSNLNTSTATAAADGSGSGFGPGTPRRTYNTKARDSSNVYARHNAETNDTLVSQKSGMSSGDLKPVAHVTRGGAAPAPVSGSLVNTKRAPMHVEPSREPNKPPSTAEERFLKPQSAKDTAPLVHMTVGAPLPSGAVRIPVAGVSGTTGTGAPAELHYPHSSFESKSARHPQSALVKYEGGGGGGGGELVTRVVLDETEAIFDEMCEMRRQMLETNEKMQKQMFALRHQYENVRQELTATEASLGDQLHQKQKEASIAHNKIQALTTQLSTLASSVEHLQRQIKSVNKFHTQVGAVGASCDSVVKASARVNDYTEAVASMHATWADERAIMLKRISDLEKVVSTQQHRGSKRRGSAASGKVRGEKMSPDEWLDSDARREARTETVGATIDGFGTPYVANNHALKSVSVGNHPSSIRESRHDQHAEDGMRRGKGLEGTRMFSSPNQKREYPTSAALKKLEKERKVRERQEGWGAEEDEASAEEYDEGTEEPATEKARNQPDTTYRDRFRGASNDDRRHRLRAGGDSPFSFSLGDTKRDAHKRDIHRLSGAHQQRQFDTDASAAQLLSPEPNRLSGRDAATHYASHRSDHRAVAPADGVAEGGRFGGGGGRNYLTTDAHPRQPKERAYREGDGHAFYASSDSVSSPRRQDTLLISERGATQVSSASRSMNTHVVESPPRTNRHHARDALDQIRRPNKEKERDASVLTDTNRGAPRHQEDDAFPLAAVASIIRSASSSMASSHASSGDSRLVQLDAAQRQRGDKDARVRVESRRTSAHPTAHPTSTPAVRYDLKTGAAVISNKNNIEETPSTSSYRRGGAAEGAQGGGDYGQKSKEEKPEEDRRMSTASFAISQRTLSTRSNTTNPLLSSEEAKMRGNNTRLSSSSSSYPANENHKTAVVETPIGVAVPSTRGSSSPSPPRIGGTEADAGTQRYVSTLPDEGNNNRQLGGLSRHAPERGELATLFTAGGSTPHYETYRSNTNAAATGFPNDLSSSLLLGVGSPNNKGRELMENVAALAVYRARQLVSSPPLTQEGRDGGHRHVTRGGAAASSGGSRVYYESSSADEASDGERRGFAPNNNNNSHRPRPTTTPHNGLPNSHALPRDDGFIHLTRPLPSHPTSTSSHNAYGYNRDSREAREIRERNLLQQRSGGQRREEEEDYGNVKSGGKEESWSRRGSNGHYDPHHAASLGTTYTNSYEHRRDVEESGVMSAQQHGSSMVGFHAGAGEVFRHSRTAVQPTISSSRKNPYEGTRSVSFDHQSEHPLKMGSGTSSTTRRVHHGPDVEAALRLAERHNNPEQTVPPRPWSQEEGRLVFAPTRFR